MYKEELEIVETIPFSSSSSSSSSSFVVPGAQTCADVRRDIVDKVTFYSSNSRFIEEQGDRNEYKYDCEYEYEDEDRDEHEPGYEQYGEQKDDSDEYRCEVCNAVYKHYTSLCRHRRQGNCEMEFIEDVKRRKSTGLPISLRDESVYLRLNSGKAIKWSSRKKRYGESALDSNSIETQNIVNMPVADEKDAMGISFVSIASLQYLLRLLLHVSICDGECPSGNCKKMKIRLQHTLECEVERNQCETCTDTFQLLALHCRKCQNENCEVLFCTSVKVTLQQRKQAREQRNTNKEKQKKAQQVNLEKYHQAEKVKSESLRERKQRQQSDPTSAHKLLLQRVSSLQSLQNHSMYVQKSVEDQIQQDEGEEMCIEIPTPFRYIL